VSSPARRASSRPARVRRRRAARLGAWAAGLAVVLIAFAVGLALGRALGDNPRPRGDRTYVRTLKPRALSPTPPTVTVTVTSR
jgi:ferric-dicitrate binding protein FerR (iron transport regulator)